MNTEKILQIFKARHARVFDREMTARQVKATREKIEKAASENRLIARTRPDGKLAYFFLFDEFRMHEFNEDFLLISNFFCADDSKSRRTFYRTLKNTAREFKKKNKIKRMVVNISQEDELSQKYFVRKGMTTALELVGKTGEGLKHLKQVVSDNKTFTVKPIKASDISTLAKLEIESHLADKSSRMHIIVKRPEGRKLMRTFYKSMLKKKNSFVVKEKKQIAGCASFFVDPKNKYGLIASIFVSNQFKGKGISKILYQRLLQEFQDKKLKYYIGSSTTDRVLSLSQKMGRRESSRYIIVKI